MKKILLTTTALMMTAGIAAAEVSFSGKAQVAITDDNGASAGAAARAVEVKKRADANNPTTAETNNENNAAATAATAAEQGYVLTTGFDFDVNVSTVADNGVTLSTSFDIGAGDLVDYDDDDKREPQSSTADAPELTIGWNGYTVSAQQNGVDNLYNSDLTGDDLGISGSMGGVVFGATTDFERNSSSVKLSYTMGDLEATYTHTNDDNGATKGGDAASKIALSYVLGDLTLTASSNDKGKADSENKVGFSYAMDSITVSYTSIDPSASAKDFGDEWDAKIAYTAGALKASLATDEADATTLIAEYDMGGGVTAFAASHDKKGTASDMSTMGITFNF